MIVEDSIIKQAQGYCPLWYSVKNLDSSKNLYNLLWSSFSMILAMVAKREMGLYVLILFLLLALKRGTTNASFQVEGKVAVRHIWLNIKITCRMEHKRQSFKIRVLIYLILEILVTLMSLSRSLTSASRMTSQHSNKLWLFVHWECSTYSELSTRVFSARLYIFSARLLYIFIYSDIY